MLTLDTAFDLVHAAVAAARERNMPVAVAMVDGGGRLLAAARSEQAGFIHLQVAERKAVTAVNFKMPTHALLEMLKGDPVALTAVMNEPTLCLLPGGFPVPVDGTPVAGLGIAGGHYTQDQAIGEAVLASGRASG